jgi:aryl-alcohol dehydrogenase-like predicted oxidoreductase
MELNRVADTDLRVSRVGLGCNNFGGRIDFDASRAVVEAALEAGITFFDTADVYGNRGGSERILGELLGEQRGDVVLATKFGNDMGEGRTGAPGYVARAVAASLERLQTDYVDVLYYHHPDGTTPIAATIEAMREQQELGKVNFLGVSNFSAEQLREAVATAPIAVLQNEYSLLDREAEDEVLPACVELGVGFVPYFPLASGLLTGKYRRGEPAPEGTRLHGSDRVESADWDRIEALAEFAGAKERTLLELSIAALASTPGVVSVIAGATRPEQVRANAGAADWQLTEAELAALRSL